MHPSPARNANSTGWITKEHTMISRRDFLKLSGAGILSLYAASHARLSRRVFATPIPGGTLDPLSIPKYQTPLLIPPVMPKARTIRSQ
jgi:spore coat protein A